MYSINRGTDTFMSNVILVRIKWNTFLFKWSLNPLLTLQHWIKGLSEPFFCIVYMESQLAFQLHHWLFCSMSRSVCARVFEAERNRDLMSKVCRHVKMGGLQHRDNEKHISAVQSRMEARETETETREREKKGDPEGGRERWRQKSKTFLPYKVLRLQLHKSVFHKSYASLFPVSPAGLSFKPSWITHSQASNSIGRTRTHTLREERETLADEVLRAACTLSSVSQHASPHGTPITGFHTILHVGTWE